MYPIKLSLRCLHSDKISFWRFCVFWNSDKFCNEDTCNPFKFQFLEQFLNWKTQKAIEQNKVSEQERISKISEMGKIRKSNSAPKFSVVSDNKIILETDMNLDDSKNSQFSKLPKDPGNFESFQIIISSEKWQNFKNWETEKNMVNSDSGNSEATIDLTVDSKIRRSLCNSYTIP